MLHSDEKVKQMEKNRVNLKICSNSYSILTEDDPEYVEELGELIDKEMRAVGQEAPSLSQTQCAVLVALDQADACKKATASADNLRAQIKDYLEDSARARMEVDVARREIERLNREISTLRTKLAEKQ
jgi:cell division protein ZapA